MWRVSCWLWLKNNNKKNKKACHFRSPTVPSYLLSDNKSNRGTPSKTKHLESFMLHRLPHVVGSGNWNWLDDESYCNWKIISFPSKLFLLIIKITFSFFKESGTDTNTQNQDLVSTRLRALDDAKGGVTLYPVLSFPTTSVAAVSAAGVLLHCFPTILSASTHSPEP